MEMTPEQLQQMSPEQIKDYQKQNCIFCHIIAGKVSSKKVYEDDVCITIMDINPANPGHVLIIPKEHYVIMPQVPEYEIRHLAMVTKAISNALLRALKAQGTNVFIANGMAAGQKAQHFMVHLVPRKDNDGLTNFTIPEKKMTSEQIADVLKRLKPKVNEVFGLENSEDTQESEESSFHAPVVDAVFEEESEHEEEPHQKEASPAQQQPQRQSATATKSKEKDVDLDKISSLFLGR